MQYRQFGQIDFQVSALGFGAMRLPMQGDTIDEPEATKMVYHAIDQGVNYVDTAYPYHGGQSEVLLGKILKNGYRDRIQLATKLPAWLIQSAADFDRYFDEQLQRLQTDHIDFYLLHALNKNTWPKIRDLKVLEWAERQIAAGRIRHLGFSFHDKQPLFMEIVDAYPWTFCQIQYNYIDINNQAGEKGFKHAASKGIAVVVMEPLLGGRLVNPPQQIQDLWNAAEQKRTPADWALQWLWNQPETATVLSGMSAMRQVEENLVSANRSGIGTLTPADIALVERVREQYNNLSTIPCTRCEYCLPCPSGVNIPHNFNIYNSALMYDKLDMARKEYTLWTPKDQQAAVCTQCQDCEEKCPQSISISQWMPVVHQVLGEGQAFRKSV